MRVDRGGAGAGSVVCGPRHMWRARFSPSSALFDAMLILHVLANDCDKTASRKPQAPPNVECSNSSGCMVNIHTSKLKIPSQLVTDKCAVTQMMIQQ
ncbi:hypothetical protein BaRGS_00017245 [Batillaria attramentaria]|uniref:Uncharacterized protein n=1 Tax=Batillaria attramentaria TaxID=370345 RepID=A0ABD0KWI7_9CAEN